MADVNGQTQNSRDRDITELDRRRRGRVAYQNEHLIAVLRGTPIEAHEEPVFPTVATASWVWLTLAGAAFWIVLISVFLII